MSDVASWISVGALADGFAPESNILPPCYDLAGQDIVLDYETGFSRQFRLERAGAAQQLVLADGSTHEARVTSLRGGLYFIDYLPAALPRSAITLLLDTASGAALEITGTLPTAAETGLSLLTRAQAGSPLTAVQASFSAARRAGRAAAPYGFPKTTELVGKRIRYRYSATELYEHIYLNPSCYTWQCLAGVEAGLADTDLCHYFKLREELYLFIWQEKIVPTLGVVTVDLTRMKTDGKIFGYAGDDFTTLTNFPVGALASIANDTPTPVLG